MNARNVIGTGLLGLIAAATWYLADSLGTDGDETTDTELEETGFYVRAARILGTGDSGELLYRLDAEYAEQRGDTEVEFEQVEIIYTTEADVPWTLNADRAVIGRDRDFVAGIGRAA